jgi:F0F1-type ATP synthase membrane subunit b/b'
MPPAVAYFFNLFYKKKMKNLSRLLLIAVFTLNTMLVSADNSSSSAALNQKNAKEYKMSKEEAKKLVTRLKEIRKMDKSNLSAQQKKELRNEVVTIKEQLTKADKGVVVYLSTIAIIIIVLLILL